MKNCNFFKTVISAVLLLAVLLFQTPNQLCAQSPDGKYYAEEWDNTLYATLDSRLTATIKQTGNSVTMTVGAVGYMFVDGFSFNILFNRDSLMWANSSFVPFNPATDVGNLGEQNLGFYPQFVNAFYVEPDLDAMGFSVIPQGSVFRDASSYWLGSGVGTGYPSVYSIDIDFATFTEDMELEIEKGSFVPLFTVFFVKANNAPLTSNTIGFHNRTNTTGSYRESAYFQFQGTGVNYYDMHDGNPYNSDLFSFRSPSSVETNGVTDLTDITATVHGTFKRGDIPEAHNLTDFLTGSNTVSSVQKNGKLLIDSIIRYGFFYSEEGEVENIDYTEYSDIITVNGYDYPFPDQTALAQGYFLAGPYRVKIAISGTSSDPLSKSYFAELTDLTPNKIYNYWAFAQYTFETSKPYPIIGDKNIFMIKPLCMAPFIVEEPSIKEPAVRCSDITPFPPLYVTADGNGLRYQWYQNTTPTTIGGIDLGSDNGAQTDTYTPQIKEGEYWYYVVVSGDCGEPVTSLVSGKHTVAESLVIAGSISVGAQPTCGENNGSIHIAASGATSYEYTLNGGTPVLLPANGMISGLTAGHYTVSIQAVSGSCNDISQTLALINSDMETIVSELIPHHANNCTSNDGSLTFTVTGATTGYEYRIDNDVNWTSVSDASVQVPNISVGDHQLFIKDANGCESPGGSFTIRATSSGIVFALTEVSKATCGGSNGSLGISVTSGVATHYRINNGNWIPMSGNNASVSVPAGSYDVELKNASGCITALQTQTIGNTGSGFAAMVTNTTPASSCGVGSGSITLSINNGDAPYFYSIDNGVTYTPITSPYVIKGLNAGVYDIRVRDNNHCAVNIYAVEVPQGLGGNVLLPPVATTPQRFCDNATVSNLQVAGGEGIEWYLFPEGGTVLNPSDALIADQIYYATQTIGNCESSIRTAVKVMIDNTVVLEAPRIEDEQSFCATTTTLTLANIATDGNPNIVWYDQPVNGTELPLTTPLVNNEHYYATIKAGDCESASRTDVLVRINNGTPEPVTITSPQHFCEGARIGDIIVPVNQVVWYTQETGGVQLSSDAILNDNVTYYAARVAGDCESAKRTPVLVYIDAPPAPTAPSPQSTCGETMTLADLTVTGGGILWFATATSTDTLPMTTILVPGKTYYAAQSSSHCQGERIAITVTLNCYTLRGTVFPFVHTDDPTFDALFPITVKLYAYPSDIDCDDAAAYIYDGTPLFTTKSVYYDGSVFVPNTPKYPGVMGWFNNPGLPIHWNTLTTATIPSVNTEVLTKSDNEPVNPIGLYTFEKIPAADYLLVISRPGFLTRIGKVTVGTSDTTYLGHREIIAGAIKNEFVISTTDASTVRGGISDVVSPRYNPKYDLNGDGKVDLLDIQYPLTNNRANFIIYQETMDWFTNLCP